MNKEYYIKYNLEHKEHIKERSAKYYQLNADEFKAKRLVYYQNNKEEILEKHKEKFECSCGLYITKNHKARHVLTKKHLDKIKQIKRLEENTNVIIK